MARKAATLVRKANSMARKAQSGPKRPSRPASRSHTSRHTAENHVIGDRYRLEGTYERLRRALLEAPNDGRLERPLSYWVLPTDRRLPIAFLDRDLRDLLSLSLSDLMETQGVGQKKILGFFDLLRRALKEESPSVPFGMSDADSPTNGDTNVLQTVSHAFDPTVVSEAVWSEWGRIVMQAGLGPQKLGRLAPSLQALPTVIWHKTLSDYAGTPLAEIRDMKTHGAKRVNAILGVFNACYEAVSTATLHEDLEIDLVPRFIPGATRWLIEANLHPGSISANEFHDQIVKPFTHQIEVDLGEQIATLAKERLSISSRPPTVIEQADRLSVTRARVYQLLEDCAKAFEVRWPEGRWLLAPLASRPVDLSSETMGLLHAVQTLFYPTERTRGGLALDD